MEIELQDKVLDLGCGYGPLGIVAASIAQQGKVYLIDSDIRAIKYSRINAGLNDITNVVIKLSDGYEEVSGIEFDEILTNLSGLFTKEVILEFIEGAKKHLYSGGKFYAVVEERNYQSIIKELKRIFDNSQVLSSKKGFFVVMAIK